MDSTPLNIFFQDLCFSVGGCWHNGKRSHKRQILRNLSGEFRACELTAIVGKSGCGKTTLLNILAGYTRRDVTGTNRIDGGESFRDIRKRSKYIMQNYTLHHFITVREAMNFAAHFKLNGVSCTCKNYKIDSILDELGLLDKMNSFTGDLSGGEQKRLTIALELIDDPMILFLDEPTTGLDSTSSTQCVQLLKKLAQEGKTIICTIHSPSAIIFDMFDHLYALADGCCIYQGASRNLVPFLTELDLVCPSTFNPTEYLLEIANNDYGPKNDILTEKIFNGRNNNYRSPTQERLIVQKPVEILLDCNIPPFSSSDFLGQLQQLLIRNFLIQTRDKCLTTMRLIIHLVIAIFIGIMYNGIGEDASNIFNIYKFLFFNIFILMFTAFSSLQTSFPLNLPITKREHFNGWYSTAAYYFALTIIDLPVIISTTLLYILITYFMTNQPMELYRFGAYYITILLLSLAAQGLGLIAGSLMNVKFTLILGSFFICPFVLFSNFFVQMKDTAKVWHWMFEISFIKHALEGSMQAIFGYDRAKMDCSAEYCHYRWPYKFNESLGITDDFQSVVIKLLTFVFVFRVISFVIMWHRLKH